MTSDGGDKGVPTDVLCVLGKVEEVRGNIFSIKLNICYVNYCNKSHMVLFNIRSMCIGLFLLHSTMTSMEGYQRIKWIK
jgi:hypothetical protein